ncbi:hypothetical protein M426DRAFT_25601 [Hypoxylon sp. CI-4A]|nr:hypothetical protein M426DRAFT_25601 [Hypoxylon sp. CI-4A]
MSPPGSIPLTRLSTYALSEERRSNGAEPRGDIIVDDMLLGKSLVISSTIASSLECAKQFVSAGNQHLLSQPLRKPASRATSILAPSKLTRSRFWLIVGLTESASMCKTNIKMATNGRGKSNVNTTYLGSFLKPRLFYSNSRTNAVLRPHHRAQKESSPSCATKDGSTYRTTLPSSSNSDLATHDGSAGARLPGQYPSMLRSKSNVLFRFRQQRKLKLADGGFNKGKDIHHDRLRELQDVFGIDRT